MDKEQHLMIGGSKDDPWDFSELNEDAELPALRDEAVADLPAARKARAPIAPDFDVDLPAARGERTLPDLPAPKAPMPPIPPRRSPGHADLPAARRPAPMPTDLDLPAARAKAPAPPKAPELPKRAPMPDLPTPSARQPVASAQATNANDWDLGAIELPQPIQALSSAPPSGDEPLSIADSGAFDVILPDSLPPGSFPPESHGDDDGLLVDDGLELEDSEDTGEADLDGALDEEGPVSGFAAAPNMGPLPQQAGPKDTAESRISRKRTKRKRVAIASIAAVLGIALGGIGLRWTPYGLFGTYFMETLTPSGQLPERWSTRLAEFRQLLRRDDYKAARTLLLQLGALREQHGLCRELLVHSLVSETLVYLRFGDNFASKRRLSAIFARLEPRVQNEEYQRLMRASYALANERLAEAHQALAGAFSSEFKTEALLLAGYLAEREGRAKEAAAIFGKARQAKGDAAAFAGQLRALEKVGDEARYAQTLIEGLLAFPHHVAWRLHKARRDNLRGLYEPALAAAVAVATSKAGGSMVLNPSPKQRSEAWRYAARAANGLERWAHATRYAENALAHNAGDLRAVLQLGIARLGIGDAKTAEGKADAMLGQGSVAPELRADAILLKTRALYAQGQYEEALRAMQELPPKAPTQHAAWLLWRGRIFAALQQPAEAEEALRASIKLDATPLETHLTLAQLLSQSGQRENEVREVLSAALKDAAQSSETLVALANFELDRNRPEAALERLNEALKGEAPEAPILLTAARAELARGAFDAADAWLSKLGKAEDFAIERLRLQGELAQKRGNPTKALAFYEKVEALGVVDAALKKSMARSFMRLENWEEAEKLLRSQLKGTPTDAEATWLLGRIELAQKTYGNAVKTLSRASSLAPSNLLYREWLALAQLRSGNLGPGLRTIQVLVNSKQASHLGLWVFAELSRQLGAARNGREAVMQAIAAEAKADYFVTLSQIEKELGRRKQALDAMLRATELSPDRALLHFQLGRLWLEMGQGNSAIPSLEMAVRLGSAEKRSPSWLPGAHRLLGLQMEARRKTDEAKEHYRAYLKLAAPMAIDREEVQERLLRLSM